MCVHVGACVCVCVCVFYSYYLCAKRVRIRARGSSRGTSVLLLRVARDIRATEPEVRCPESIRWEISPGGMEEECVHVCMARNWTSILLSITLTPQVKMAINTWWDFFNQAYSLPYLLFCTGLKLYRNMKYIFRLMKPRESAERHYSTVWSWGKLHGESVYNHNQRFWHEP